MEHVPPLDTLPQVLAEAGDRPAGEAQDGWDRSEWSRAEDVRSSGRARSGEHGGGKGASGGGGQDNTGKGPGHNAQSKGQDRVRRRPRCLWMDAQTMSMVSEGRAKQAREQGYGFRRLQKTVALEGVGGSRDTRVEWVQRVPVAFQDMVTGKEVEADFVMMVVPGLQFDAILGQNHLAMLGSVTDHKKRTIRLEELGVTVECGKEVEKSTVTGGAVRLNAWPVQIEDNGQSIKKRDVMGERGSKGSDRSGSNAEHGNREQRARVIPGRERAWYQRYRGEQRRRSRSS